MRKKNLLFKNNLIKIIFIQLFSFILIFPIFVLFNSSVIAIPMIRENNNFINKKEFEEFKNLNIFERKDVEELKPPKTPTNSGGNINLFSELIENLNKSDFVQIFIKMLKQIEEALKQTGNSKNQKIERNVERRSTLINEKQRNAFSSNLSRQLSPPFSPPIPRSPTINKKFPKDEKININFSEEISESIDAKPLIIKSLEQNKSSATLNNIPSPSSLPSSSIYQINGMSTILKEAFNNKEWKNSLFGKSGLLTEIFNFVNDKRKEEIAKQTKLNSSPILISNNNNNNNDFTKILDVLLSSPQQNGKFEEPQLPEIPFLGICNRVSCADIYKALDEFKRSEFFSNFQTAISLLNDPKGFDMIGELLANPDLLETFTGPESISQLFGKGNNNNKNKKEFIKGEEKLIEIAENKDDENIGIDFSSTNEETNKPKILFSIDGKNKKSEDYYSNLEEERNKGKEKINLKIPKITKEENIKNEEKKTEEKGKNIELPEIAKSIDAKPISLDEEDEFPEGQIILEKSEIIPLKTNNNNKTKEQQIIIFSKKEKELNRKRNEEAEITKITTKIFLNQTDGNKQKLKTKTTTPIMTTITRRNFRKDDDYYSMYYDNNDDINKIRKSSKNSRNKNK
uniref:Uncharacterized protein n=1 Tax=Meloidogyne enterolobii TaxID=390850 RepID=A0A6V7VC87_MELEN|nr:unnamed protein product [Meloidogyne enterolobii]